MSPKIKMPGLSRREIILVAIFLLALVFFGYYRFVFEPYWNTIKKLQADLRTQQQMLSMRKAQGWDDIPDLRNQSDELRDKINEMYKRIPNIKDEPGLLVDFYKMAVSKKLNAETIKFSALKEVSGKDYSTFDITLEFLGSNANIYSFIEALEKYPRMNRISQIKFTPLSSTDSACSLTAEFYVLHELRPDPLEYPFMVGEGRKNQPYNIFDMYQKINTSNLKPGAQSPGTQSPGTRSPGAQTPAGVPPAPASPPPQKTLPPTGSAPKTQAPPKNQPGEVAAAKGKSSGSMIILKEGIVWYPDDAVKTKGQVIPPSR